MTRSGIWLPLKGRVRPRPAVQRSPSPEQIPSYGRGQRLPADVEELAESSFSHDFSAVQVHADDTAAKASLLHNARAFTVGTHVVFGAGEYRPHAPDGQRLLAHELAHVVQQARGGAAPDLRPGNALDADADRAAHDFSGASQSRVAGASAVGVARAPLESLNVTKLSDTELQARAAMLSRWFEEHTPDDAEYETRLSLASDVFVESFPPTSTGRTRSPTSTSKRSPSWSCPPASPSSTA